MYVGLPASSKHLFREEVAAQNWWIRSCPIDVRIDTKKLAPPKLEDASRYHCVKRGPRSIIHSRRSLGNAMHRSLLVVLCVTVCSVATARSQGPNRPKPEEQSRPSFSCADPVTEKACNSLKEMVIANDAVVAYLTSNRALACFLSNEDAFFVISYDTPRDRDQRPANADPLTKGGQIFFRQFRNGTEDREGLHLAADGDWYEAVGSFVSKRLFGSDAGGSFEDDFGKLLIDQGTELTLRHSIRKKDGSDSDYRLTIRLSTGRFNEESSTAENEPVVHSGHCLDFVNGTLQDKTAKK
ncbi:MAG: hypothetical protein ABSE53_15505 [Terracidiphilus sp.]